MHFKLTKLLVLVGLLTTGYAHASSNLDTLYGLAQKCYAIQSPKNGDFMQRYHKGGILNDGLSYRFKNIPSSSASRFFMKPTVLGKYMLTDVDGRFLAGHATLSVTAGKKPESFSEWLLTITQNGNGENLVEFKSNALGMKLRHNYRKGKAYFFDFWNMFNRKSESKFKLVSLDDCTPYPEITLNVEGNREALKGDVSNTVRGFVEGHAHLSSYEFIGGKMLHG